MFFHKELFCEKCHAPINKKNICTFDYSLQRRNKTGRKISLCQDCCLKELAANLRKHSQKAVIIQPTGKYDTYAFYSFKMLSEGVGHSMDKDTILKYIQDIESFLPKDNEECNRCSSHASYTWCTMNIYSKDNPSYMYINLAEKKDCIYLCTDCLINLLRKKIQTENIHFREIYPMVDDEAGFYTPW